MLLTARSGVDLPVREYDDDDKPSKRLAYKQEVENSWWNQWKVHCFDSLLPTQAWHQEKRGVRPGDIVLISYSDKSKTGTFRLGRVESTEVDEDGLVRTCVVQYRLVRADLPKEDMLIYFKGLKCKSIRVPVQRLVMILPVDEEEMTVKNKEDIAEEIIEHEVAEIVEDKSDNFEVVKEILSDEVTDVEPDTSESVEVKNYWIKSYRTSLIRRKRVMKTSRTIKSLFSKMNIVFP